MDCARRERGGHSQVLRHPPRLQRTQGRHPENHERVEPHDPPTEVIGGAGLQLAVGADVVEDHGAPREGQGHRCREPRPDQRHGCQRRSEEHARQPDDPVAREPVADGRHGQCADTRPHADGGHQPAVTGGARGEHVPGIDRQHAEGREPENAECRRQHEQGARLPRAKRVAGPFQEGGGGVALPLSGTGAPHEQQGSDGGEEAGGIQEEADGDPRDRDQATGDDRPDDAGQVEVGRVQRDGVHEVLPAHHLHQEGLADGHLERRRGAVQRRQQHHPFGGDVMGGGQHPQGQRIAQHEALQHQQRPPPVDPVRQHPAPQGKEQDRQRAERAHQADHEGRVGQLQYQPPLGHDLHPGADQRHELTDEEKPEVAMPEGGERCGHGGRVTGAEGRVELSTPSGVC